MTIRFELSRKRAEQAERDFYAAMKRGLDIQINRAAVESLSLPAEKNPAPPKMPGATAQQPSSATGIATITLTISDGSVSSTITFTLIVQARPEYELVELPIVPGTGGNFPLELNDNGQIVGESLATNIRRPLLWDARGTPAVTVLRNHVNSTARAINNAGDIVGFTTTRGFLLHAGNFTTVGTTGISSAAADINESGLIVGEISTPDSIFLFDGATQTTLAGTFYVGLPNNAGSLRVNSKGDVLGLSPTRNAAVLWQITDTTMGTRTVRNLGNLGAATGPLNRGGINNAGNLTLSGVQVRACTVGKGGSVGDER